MRISKFVGAVSALTIAISAFSGLAVTANAEQALQTQITGAGETATTITLDDDYTEDITIASGQNITIALNGHTITNNSGHTITNNGTLTVTGSGTVDNVTHAKAALVNNGTATLSGGSFTRSKEDGTKDSNSYYTVANYGTMTIDGASVSNNGAFSSCVLNSGSSASLTVSSGEISGGASAIINKYDGKLTVSGGTITNGSAIYAIYNYGTADITGGTITGNVASKSDDDDTNAPAVTNIGGTATITTTGGAAVTVDSGATANISGGTLSGADTGVSSSGTLNITGGTITGSSYGIYASGSTITVSDGTITGATGVVLYGGSMTTTGGTITATTYDGVWAYSGTATISGGTVNAGTSGTGICTESGGTITVTDGTINGTVKEYSTDSDTIEVSGGEFTDAASVQEYLAEDCNMVATTDDNGNIVYEAVNTSDESTTAISYTFEKSLNDFNSSAKLTVTGLKANGESATFTNTLTTTTTTFTGTGDMNIAVILTGIPRGSVIKSVTLE